ncbi:AAA family ATPase [Boudabousia marimammalium]|nr:ATP-binding protein [Boudabousia marimammalium]
MTPPLLVGREDILDEVQFALDNGPGTHERVTVITGPRGIGKTVLLNAIEDLALQRGWVYFSETATKGFLPRLIGSAQAKITELAPKPKRKLTGLSISGAGGLDWENVEHTASPSSLRENLTRLLDLIDETDAKLRQETGLFITLDELHHLQRDEIIELATTVQHLIRESRNIALFMAGIPGSVKPLLGDNAGRNPITFLRRANRVTLGRVDTDFVREGLAVPVQNLGLRWDEDALDEAATACDGYPFMIQLVGQYSFAARQGDTITAASVRAGISRARTKLGQLVHEPALADLSEKDRVFLGFMAEDEEDSAVAEIADRMGVSAQYANNYRRRLIDAEMIEPTQRGRVKFALPYLREYLRENYS